MFRTRKEEQGGNKPILPFVNGYALLLLPMLLILLSGVSYGTTVPISLQNSTANPIVISACTANFLGGTCTGTDTIGGVQKLTSNLFIFGNFIQSGGSTLTTSGYSIIASQSANIMGTVLGGNVMNGASVARTMGGNFTLSYGGSGGANSGGSGGNGGNTLVHGGVQPGGSGGIPAAPTLTTSNIIYWFGNGMANFLSGAGGGTGSIVSGGSGSFGVFIEANTFACTGTITTSGYAGVGATGQDSTGGGGAGIILVANGIGGYSVGSCTFNENGGAGGTSISGTGGAGGNGRNLQYKFSTPPVPILTQNYYPIKIYSSTSPNIGFTTNSVYNGIATTVQSNAVSVSYVPPANQISGVYIFNITETNTISQATSIVLINTSINMTDITGAYTMNLPTIQYFPNFAACPSFSIKPVSWYIQSDNAGSYGKKNQTGLPCGDVWSNANATFQPMTFLTYNGFSSFLANVINNPMMTNSITQTTFKFSTSNTAAVAPVTRKILNISSFNQKNFAKLVANTSIAQTATFNNYTLLNVSAFNANTFSEYISSGNFINPTYTFISLTTSTTAPNHVLSVNNFCPLAVNASTFRSLFVYPVDTGNGTLTSFSVFAGFGSVINDYIQVMDGISNLSATSVQQYNIQAVPFQIPLIQAGSYAFRILNSHCNVIYSTNYSVWTSPITIQVPNILPTPKLNLSRPTVSCSISWSNINLYSTASCNGTDPTNLVSRWQIQLYNTSSLNSYAILNNSLINGTGFTWTYHPLSNSSIYNVKVVAIQGNGAYDPLTPFFFTLNNTLFSGFNVPADGFICLIFMLIGLGGGKVSTGEGSIVHQISNTCFIEALILFFLWAVGLAAFMGAIIPVLMLFLIAIGIISYRYEGQGGFISG